MSNDYRNSEGYPDPTAGEALSRIAANEKQSLRAFRPIVYMGYKHNSLKFNCKLEKNACGRIEKHFV